jgi:hypothetical protein
MSAPEQRSRPEGGLGTAGNAVAALPQDTGAPRIPHLTAADIAAARPLYLLVVKTQADRVLRRTYLSLAAAEQAVKRAQARGQAVTLELHRLVPYTTGAEFAEAVITDA